MSAKITLTNAIFDRVPGINQVVTVRYRKTSDPDIPGSYTTVTLAAPITPAGVFSPPVEILGLDNDTSYTVRVTNNCNGQFVDTIYITPKPSCVNLLGIIGTTAEE